MRCLRWHSGMPLCRIQTVLPVLQHRQAAPNPLACNRWMTWMDSSKNKMMVPTYLHVPVCCFLLHCFQGVAIHSFVVIQFSYFLAPTFSPFSPFGFQCCTCLFYLVVIQFSNFSCSHIFPIVPFWFSMSFFCFCNYYVSEFPRWFPNDQWFFNCVKASLFPVGFCFFSRGGGAHLI